MMLLGHEIEWLVGSILLLKILILSLNLGILYFLKLDISASL